MSRLSGIIEEEVEAQEPQKPKGGRWGNLAYIIASLFIVGALMVMGSGTVIALAVAAWSPTTTTTTMTSSTVTTVTVTTSTSSTTTSSTTSTTTTSTTSTTTTSTTTTSTTLCGGYYELACGGEDACNDGFVENSAGYCLPYGCAPTVASGNPGCGSQNLGLPENWCQPGHNNPFSSRTG